MLAAAQALFLERGYVSTTVEAIAERADVSAETIYSTLRNKRSILAELVDVSIAGGQGQPPVLEQAWVQAMRDAPDPRARLGILARNGRAILERRAALDDVVRSAASTDPEIATLWQRGKDQRRAGQRELLRIVIGTDGLRAGLDLEQATDALYTLGSPETYRLLVVDRGWSPEAFETWYADALRLLLLPGTHAEDSPN